MRKTPLNRKTPMSRGKGLKKTPKIPKPKVKKEKVPSDLTLDTLFSQYIRRFGECQLWKYGGVQCSMMLDCSHIISRTYKSVRWDVDNAVCACKAHHFWQHKHPVQSTLALIEILGPEHMERLNDKYLAGKKPTPDEKRAIAAWLREELKKAA
jgi:hypothetical protein